VGIFSDSTLTFLHLVCSQYLWPFLSSSVGWTCLYPLAYPVLRLQVLSCYHAVYGVCISLFLSILPISYMAGGIVSLITTWGFSSLPILSWILHHIPMPLLALEFCLSHPHDTCNSFPFLDRMFPPTPPHGESAPLPHSPHPASPVTVED